MRYLCLCYYNEQKFAALAESELAALGPACRPHDEALRRSGQLIMVGSLGLPEEARSLRPGSGGPSVSAGPFAATREPVGAFFIIEAGDLDEAVEVAAKHPAAHLGAHLGWGIEVRPIETLDRLG